MAQFDPKNNFAFSTVIAAPTPALSGIVLQLATGEGALFPAAGGGVGYNVVVCPANATPTPSNAEIVRVIGRAGDVLTITRTQEGSLARSIQVGDRVFSGPTVKSFTDLEAPFSRATPAYGPAVTPNASAGRWQTITATDNVAFTINAPTNPPDSAHTAELAIEISNASGGVMGAVTWDASFLLVGGAFTKPANGKKRFIRFEWNGAAWIETGRAGADY